ncbi:MAG: type II toxin-antitoxin system HicA family toxin [Candidatus Gracilibacteria bacterium]|nr:type II toxin-antitoxin system HicA family toxin [Candidatus Gracilibacteria bacterium]MDD5179607.1 type II toxin-antitoxin system HicA family toxin [Candidatus Gracilibacteria bacterium]
MNQSQKVLAKFLRNPTSLRYSEVHKILIEFGFQHKRISGSHNIYQNITLPADISIPIHNNDCKDVYKKEVAKIIKKIIKTR